MQALGAFSAPASLPASHSRGTDIIHTAALPSQAPSECLEVTTPTLPISDHDLVVHIQGSGSMQSMWGCLPLNGAPSLLLPRSNPFPSTNSSSSNAGSCAATFGVMHDGVQSGRPSLISLHTNARISNETELVLRVGRKGEAECSSAALDDNLAHGLGAGNGLQQKQQQQQQLILGPGDQAWLPAPLLLQSNQPGRLFLFASTTHRHPQPDHSFTGTQQQQLQPPATSSPGTEIDLDWMVLEVERQLERQQEQRRSSGRVRAWQQPGIRKSSSASGPSSLWPPQGPQHATPPAHHSPTTAQAPPSSPPLPPIATMAGSSSDIDQRTEVGRDMGEEVWASRRVQVKCAGWSSQTGATVERDYAAVVAGVPGTVHLLLVLSRQEGSKVRWEQLKKSAGI